MQPGVPFDTSNVLFICGGAFVSLEEIIAKRLGRGGFGFGQMSENRQVASDGLLRQVKPKDLEAFGLIPEIIGRLPVIAPLDAVGVDDLATFFRLRRIRCSAVQEIVPVPRCGPVVHRCGGQGDRPDRFESWSGNEGVRGRWSRRSWKGFCSRSKAGVRYVVTDKTVRGGEAVKQSITQTRAPLSWYVLRRLAAGKTG